MGRFTKWLLGQNPRTGRLILEDGAFVNHGDKVRDDRLVDALLQVEAGNVYQADYRGAIPAGGTLYFGQPVNTGRITGVILTANFSGGPIEYTQVAGATPGAEIGDQGAINADRRITAAGLNPVKEYDGFNGGRLIENDFGLVPTTGTGRGVAALSGAGVGGIYGTNSAPFFSYENTGSSAAEISIRWVWRE